MSSPRPLTSTPATVDPHTVRVVLSGDLSYDNGDDLVRVVDTAFAGGEVRHLHLDCADVGFCDSYGLATLLSVQRRATAAGVVLSLDNRPATLERLLRRTNTLHHLTAGARSERRERSDH
ncbi:STAS domain-containing protein [Saccharothrix longispora]|uniref:Anti-anti-sigma factor n=1 Tax=Saccharothrix longispora TaxID=33920 RepID=A0ABU1PTE6_9PSEU|nr:STAS domain-containing protein [Saccharothrix longispora]MDR6593925.1 anti-anti-sigma factor [Saccharothrix longispora]